MVRGRPGVAPQTAKREWFARLIARGVLGMPVFFCKKASPWQRPSNENTNGLLRQYFPKHTDLRVHDAARITEVAAELNDRPRKTLGWDTPAERLARARLPIAAALPE